MRKLAQTAWRLTLLKGDTTSSVGRASQFIISSNTCDAILVPNATCQVGVTFAPTRFWMVSAFNRVGDGVVFAPDGIVLGFASD